MTSGSSEPLVAQDRPRPLLFPFLGDRVHWSQIRIRGSRQKDRSSRSGCHVCQGTRACSGVQGSKQSQRRSRRGVDAGTSLWGPQLDPDMHWALDGGNSLVPRSHLQLLLGLVGILLEHLAALRWGICQCWGRRIASFWGWILPFLFKKNLYLFILAVLGLHCCIGVSLVVASGGYSLVVVCGLLVVVASLVVEHRL